MYQKIEGYRREWGRESREFANGIYLYVNFGDSAESALEVTKATLLARYTYPVYHIHAGVNAILGTVEECVRVLKEYEAVGATHVILDPVCPAEEVPATVERVAREIMPHFK